MMKKIDVVGAVIVNEKGDILCALRSQRMSMPGLWEFPGGKVELEETPEAALQREIKEELSIKIEVGDLIADVTHEYPALIVRLLTYYAVLADKDAVPCATEHEKIIWVEHEKLKELHWAPADVPTVEKLVECHNGVMQHDKSAN
ncbi:(deoxy)nucleoside triphosphate pyrophosphohydrolase [Aneurinibacillus aneurinilyticus]|nr:(deoxy)nucleoside triphosphate pyrophosphohydrolase [Aneurinibacillus aneurinilyticus]MED0707539.1 (deoxy)nucleoside triphosphate pyrophosphohydrolase [Aneurinibacillus aneurinilyticus]MED0723907.1 (deoxy)nucleoside triphosphate pyrophosphohydrolase [Aneurinibacillus aneurinilyticus]MED0731759.1 (deoxy)nucleoside triphosphate pyrophosphohydrolase [Aneurinibacillus aneurinilyticus]MED0739421.1 (deoxy)nucleoside triphosphate pyrophosphohydrolase [Aneurinibacillus aneurinilyticus]